MGNGLRGVTLRYPYEVRSEAEYFADIPDMKLPPDMIKLAGHIVKTMESDFDPAMFQDRERAAMVELLNKKQRALPKPERSVPSRENIVNLMDALKRSLSSKGVSVAKPRARRSPDVAAAKAKPSAKRRKIS
jgi:non-homologous end joining protein Ku